MQNAALVRVGHGGGDGLQEFGGAARGERTVAQQHREVAALDVFHREVLLAFVFSDLVDADDIRMTQAGGGFRLGAEASHLLRRGQRGLKHPLHRHDAIEAGLPRGEDDAHPAARDFLDQFVVAKILDGIPRAR